VQEVDGEDPARLGVQKLPPGRTGASRRRVNARGMQDLPHGRRRNGDPEFRQLVVDAAVSPQRILLRQENDEACGARECWREAGLAPVARPVLSRGQPAVPGQSFGWPARTLTRGTAGSTVSWPAWE